MTQKDANSISNEINSKEVTMKELLQRKNSICSLKTMERKLDRTRNEDYQGARLNKTIIKLTKRDISIYVV
jgi:hypothetical protein